MGKSFRNFDKKSSDDAYLEKRKNQNHADHIKEKRYLSALKTQDVEAILEMEDDCLDNESDIYQWEAENDEFIWATEKNAYIESKEENDSALL